MSQDANTAAEENNMYNQKNSTRILLPSSGEESHLSDDITLLLTVIETYDIADPSDFEGDTLLGSAQ